MSKLRPALVASLVLMAACEGTPFATPSIETAVSEASANIAANLTKGPHLGFDTYAYPGDDEMRAWQTATKPYKWVGYYLSAPCHRDASFMGKRETLSSMGWGM